MSNSKHSQTYTTPLKPWKKRVENNGIYRKAIVLKKKVTYKKKILRLNSVL